MKRSISDKLVWLAVYVAPLSTNDFGIKFQRERERRADIIVVTDKEKANAMYACLHVRVHACNFRRQALFNFSSPT